MKQVQAGTSMCNNHDRACLYDMICLNPQLSRQMPRPPLPLLLPKLAQAWQPQLSQQRQLHPGPAEPSSAQSQHVFSKTGSHQEWSPSERERETDTDCTRPLNAARQEFMKICDSKEVLESIMRTYSQTLYKHLSSPSKRVLDVTLSNFFHNFSEFHDWYIAYSDTCL